MPALCNIRISDRKAVYCAIKTKKAGREAEREDEKINFQRGGEKEVHTPQREARGRGGGDGHRGVGARIGSPFFSPCPILRLLALPRTRNICYGQFLWAAEPVHAQQSAGANYFTRRSLLFSSPPIHFPVPAIQGPRGFCARVSLAAEAIRPMMRASDFPAPSCFGSSWTPSWRIKRTGFQRLRAFLICGDTVNDRLTRAHGK
jgi:hypothetical protein